MFPICLITLYIPDKKELKTIEHQIIDLLKKGDKTAVSLIYDHYSGSLFGVLMRMLKNEADAKDVLQESLIKIWRKGATFDANKARLFTWMLTICRNTALDRLRSNQRKQEREIQLPDHHVYDDRTERSINPDVIDLKDHLDKIESKYRDVIRVLFFQGMSQQEASEALDLPLGTIKTRLRIGLRELRKIYGELLIQLILVTLMNL